MQSNGTMVYVPFIMVTVQNMAVPSADKMVDKQTHSLLAGGVNNMAILGDSSSVPHKSRLKSTHFESFRTLF